MKYRDEKYVEALEAEVKALRAELKVREKLGVGYAKGVGKASAVTMEEMMTRARTEIAAEAGAGYGRVSLEAMYLLPSEFTNAYQRLFLKALKESPGQASGEANVLVKGNPQLTKGKVVKEGKNAGKVLGVDKGAPLDRDPDRGGGQARGGGKRHRDHWLIKDEGAFRLKQRVDRELQELALLVATELACRPVDGSRAAGSSDGTIPDKGNSGTRTPQCTKCQRFLKATWQHCPGCGVRRE